MITSSQFETEQFGRSFATQLRSGDVVALHGDLGSGKTTLVKGIVSMLSTHLPDEVSSPTFTYLNIYEAAFPLYHFDLYRLDKKTFLQHGFLDFFEEEGICLLEWPGNIGSLLPTNALHITLTHLDENRRRIDVHRS